MTLVVIVLCHQTFIRFDLSFNSIYQFHSILSYYNYGAGVVSGAFLCLPIPLVAYLVACIFVYRVFFFSLTAFGPVSPLHAYQVPGVVRGSTCIFKHTYNGNGSCNGSCAPVRSCNGNPFSSYVQV